MRWGFASVVFTFAVAAALGASEAACRGDGRYRITGPNSAGWLTLKETKSDSGGSSGTVDLFLSGKQSFPTAITAGFGLTGDYVTVPFQDECTLILKVFDPVANRRGEVDGTLAFGGAVILFHGFSYEGPSTGLAADLNLTLGIRNDAFVRPSDAAAPHRRVD